MLPTPEDFLDKNSGVSDSELVLRAVDFAISAEEEANHLYSGLSSRAKARDVKDFFSFLAKEELLHKAVLLELKKSLAKKGPFSAPAALSYSGTKPFVHPSFSGDSFLENEDEAIRKAIKVEAAFRDFYFRLSLLSKDPAVSSVFKKLSEFENKHFWLLNQLQEQSTDTSEFVMG